MQLELGEGAEGTFFFASREVMVYVFPLPFAVTLSTIAFHSLFVFHNGRHGEGTGYCGHRLGYLLALVLVISWLTELFRVVFLLAFLISFRALIPFVSYQYS